MAKDNKKTITKTTKPVKEDNTNDFVALFKYFGLGIVGCFDFLMDIIINFVTYFGLGISKIAGVCKKGGNFVWLHGGKKVYSEIAAVIIAAVDGFVAIFAVIFVIIPGLLKPKPKPGQVAKTATKMSAARKAATTTRVKKTKLDPGYKPNAFEQIFDYIRQKYEKIPFVQKQKIEKEKNLKPVTINKDNPNDVYRYQVKQTFRYLVRTPEGKLVTGYFPAYSKMEVYSYLLDQNMIIYEIYTSKLINFLHTESNAMKNKMSTKDLVFWLTQLSTYIKAGIPLMDAVRVLAKQDKRKKYQSLYDSLIYELTMGATFSDALDRQGRSFPSLLVNMVKASELSGTIEQTLDEMADYYQEMEDNRKDVISAIAYPCVVLVFAIGICTFMLVYIVPKFADVYASMGSEINPITQFCLDLSDFLANNWYFIIGGIVIVVIAYSISFKKVKAFRELMQSLFLRLPVVSKVIISKEINMFARTFATLQHNNVLIADSIDVLAKITENELYKQLMVDTINNLVKGNKMSESFKDNWIIPDIAYFMIVTGESTGELAEMLDRVADYYRKEQKNAVAGIKTFVEPALIVFLAVAVGFILIAVLVPMFDMYSTVM